MEAQLSHLAEDAALASLAAQQVYGGAAAAAGGTSAGYAAFQAHPAAANANAALAGGSAVAAGVGGSGGGHGNGGGGGGGHLVYDARSGYYYDRVTGYYCDQSRGLYFHPTTQAWYSYDAPSGTYAQLPAATDALAAAAAARGGDAAADNAAAEGSEDEAALPVPTAVELGGSASGKAVVKLSLSLNNRKTPLARLKTVAATAAGTLATFAPERDDDADDAAPPTAAPSAAEAAGALAVPAEQLALADFQNLVCRLCARRLASAETLRRHLLESALHRDKYAELCAARERQAAEEEERARRAADYTRQLDAIRSTAVGKNPAGMTGGGR
jgi:hypothetical protein